MITLNNISYSYVESSLLKDFSLDIDSNQIITLLGSSGSGKTTLLRLISGLEIPQKGEISIDGKSVFKEDKVLISPSKRKIGFIFQDLALWPHFTVYKNIAFGLEENKQNNVKSKVLDILEYFGIQDEIDKYPHQLSGGQKQLVAIARALVLKPKVLLMDEPLANLDVKLKRKILEHIKQLKQKFKITIIYVTHDHKEAFSISDRIVVLNNGKIEAEGTVDDIKNSNNDYVKYFLEY